MVEADDVIDEVCFKAALRGDVKTLRRLEEVGVVHGAASVIGCIEGLHWAALEYVLDSVSRRPSMCWSPYSDFRECLDGKRAEFMDRFYRLHKSQWDAATCTTSGRR